MSNEKKRPEFILHPFSGVKCEVVHLQPGAELEAGDLYRSVTLARDGSPIGPEAPGIGRWYAAGDLLDGSIIHPECNVHFVRLLPVVDEEMSREEFEKHMLVGGHAVG